MRRKVLPLVLIGVLAGLVAEAAAYDWDQPGLWVPDLVVGWTLIGAGIAAWALRAAPGAGWLMILTGLTWFAGLTPATLYWHRGPLVHLLIAFAGWRPRSRLDWVGVVVGYVAAMAAPIWANDRATVLLGLGLVGVTRRGYALAPARVRHVRRAAAHAALLLAAVLAAGALARTLVPSGDTVAPALLVYQVVVAGIGVFLLASLPITSAGAVADVVVELGDRQSGSARDRLAKVLADPTLEMGYWSPAAGTYLSEEGTPVEVPAQETGRGATQVDRGGARFALLVHDSATLRDPALLDVVVEATRTSDAHLALQRELREQVVQLEDSRHRLVVAADAERRRLDARLQQGPEYRLTTLGERLSRIPGEQGFDPHLTQARDHIAQARADLRALSAGLHPRELASDGLAGALRALAQRAPCPVDIDAQVPPLPQELQTATYFVCSEALANVAKHAHATRAGISVTVEGNQLSVSVSDDGIGGVDPTAGSGLLGLADRVQSLGGTLRVTSPAGGGTRIVGRMPVDRWRG
ncbi:MAG TPA: ATP-binding protein [Motilibacterales bacterium]|nr:ATP-binding protein [Motilibacterales bacterium]